MSQLFRNLYVFIQLLRNAGVPADPERARMLVRAIDQVGLRRKEDFYLAARSTLVVRREDLPIFDRLFEAFWRRPADARLRHSQLKKLDAFSLATHDKSSRRFSSVEVLREKDFSKLTEPEREQIQRLIASLPWRLGERISRRYRPRGAERLDLRRSMRASLPFGGEWLLQAFRQRKRKPRPLVMLADISGSMEPYTRLLLHFAYALVRGLAQPVEVFVFGTRLSRITRQLRNRRLESALAEISSAVPDWSGGTRIGEALRSFNFEWARRVLSRGAIVALISDGLDRGQMDLLAAEIARLQRSCYRLIWLNPLSGTPQYQPIARGMQAAMPFVDDFRPIHNFNSLERLATHLVQVSSRRPSRRQSIAQPFVQRSLPQI
jgi:uncharacterized protein with von Willebrand factor type A (vWA) domain